jgi:peptidylprolyl isomerase
MVRVGFFLSSVAATLAVSAAEPQTPQQPLTMADVLTASTASDWRAIEPENTLYMELEPGRVIIELAPEFAPQLVANIRALARAGFFNGLFITRAQDNYVVQWGDAEAKRDLGQAKARVPVEFERKAGGLAFTALPDVDAYAPQTGFANGFPAARDPRTGQAWLTHCYGMVGAGRDDAPDSGNGTELYTVIGNAPRHLDRNIALVGRIVQGIELLSVMPRGKGVMGFYEPAEQRAAIRSVRVASDVPESERSPLEALRTDTATFAAMVESRRNRREKWFLTPAGHIEVCNVPLPVRATSHAR